MKKKMTIVIGFAFELFSRNPSGIVRLSCANLL